MSDNALPYRWTYGKNGDDITSQMYAEDDADRATAWPGAHEGPELLNLFRTPRDRWRIRSAGTFNIPISAYDRRFSSPGEALGWLAQRAGLVPVPAVCRCGESGAECD